MKLNIITEKKNDLLGRKDFVFSMEFEGATPKTVDVIKKIASLTKSEENLVVVKIIKNNFGQEKSIVHAYVYNSLDTLKKIEKYEEPAAKEAAKEE